jgi:Kef-type K+ transport system membrane component KefB
MDDFFPFFLIVFAGVFFSAIFKRIHVPWVVALLTGGVLIGPHVLNLITITPTAEFIGQVGLVFLMFMAGLETRFGNFKGFQGRLLWLAFINGAIPGVIGFALGYLFGYSFVPSLLIGIIFVSSSIAVVIPSLENFNMLKTKLGQSVVMTTVIQDVASLILLSVLLQSVSPATNLPLYAFYPLVLIVFVAFRLLLPKVRKFFISDVKEFRDIFQQEFRSTFLVLLGTVIAFEFLGLHPIIAGFFAGLILSDSIKNPALKEKIRTISYGIFIPTFFIIIGAQTDITVLRDATTTVPLVMAIVIGSVVSKFSSGWLGGKIAGFDSNQALFFGVSSIPQLSTTLAVAFTALSLGLIDQKLITAMVMLSVFTVIISPPLMTILGNRLKESIKSKATS